MALITKVLKSTCRCFSDMKHFGRLYSRNVVIRKPVRVLNAQPEKSVIAPIQDPVFAHLKDVSSSLKSSEDVESCAVIEKEKQNVVPYEKLKKNDARFTKIVGIIKNKKKRIKSGKILLEGKRLINDAIKVGMKMESIYFSREEDLIDIKIKNPEDVDVYKVLYRTLQIWSSVTTCPGVMAVFKRPSADDLSVLSQPVLPVTILCDNIREPGNLGSIIRNAAAAGCENILLTKGCVDPWEPKVLRTGCGGHFRIPIVSDIEWSKISNYIPSNSAILIADNSADIDEVDLGAGFIDFNVDDIEGSEEEAKYVTFNEYNQPVHIDETFDSQTELEKFEDVHLPCHLYSCIKYPQKHIVLYIGGETHGIDTKIVKLACEYGGKKIKIPMENEMESINSAFALTVILFEIKRQHSQLYVTKK